MKLSRTNGRGLDLFQHLTRGQQLGRRSSPWHATRDRDPSIDGARRLHAAVAAVTYQMQTDPGDSSGEATPVPIPNTEVKLSSAEDTERAAFRENRSSPGSLHFCASSPRRGDASRGRYPPR